MSESRRESFNRIPSLQTFDLWQHAGGGLNRNENKRWLEEKEALKRKKMHVRVHVILKRLKKLNSVTL